MKRTRHTAEQIIRKLKTAEQLIAQGKTVADVCRLKRLLVEAELDEPKLRPRLREIAAALQSAPCGATHIRGPADGLTPQSMAVDSSS